MLAGKFARRCRLDLDDCESVAMLALARSARTFDPLRGVKFTTLAYNAISRALWQQRDRCAFDLVRRPRGAEYRPRRVSLPGEFSRPGRPDGSPLDAAARRESVDRLRSAMVQTLLPERLDEVSRYYTGADFRVLSLAAGVQDTTVGVRVRESVKTLRATLVPADQETAS
jgi:hypothetical protein